MTLGPKFRLVVTRGDDGGPAAQSAQGGGGFQAQFPSLSGDQVGNFVGFEMAPHVFHRIEFGRIGRQAMDLQTPFCAGNEAFDQGTAMNGRAVPQDENLSGNMPQEVLQKENDLGALDAAGIKLKVEAPKRQSANEGKALPIEGFLQKRGLPAWRPSASPAGARAQAAFVDEDDSLPLAAGFFFRAGHSTCFQRRMAFSSRSTARRSGRWQLKPLAPSSRQT
jgi:hypothetical protein